LRGIVISGHNPMPGGHSASVRRDEEQFPEYLRLVARARETWKDHVDVLLGLECDYMPAMVDYVEQQIWSADFHSILRSVHPHVAEYRAAYWSDDPVAVQKQYFDHLADAAETGLFDCLSHPDLIKHMTVDDWDFGRLLGHVRKVLDRIARSGVAMELNTSSYARPLAEPSPSRAMLVEMRQRNIPVVLGADAHSPDRVGDRFEQALDLLADVGYTHCSYFVDRRRRDVAIYRATESLIPVTDSTAAG
jgi:histidinol-phosphatase (PHP family)